MKSYTAWQVCANCGAKFRVTYFEDGTYEYHDDVCDCEDGDGFYPAEGEPSISEWLEQIKKS